MTLPRYIAVVFLVIYASSVAARPKRASCGHDEFLPPYHHKLQNTVLPLPDGTRNSACLGYGKCDSPEVRDSTPQSPKQLRMSFIVICDDHGNCPSDMRRINGQFIQLVSDYKAANIGFRLTSVRFVNDSSCASYASITRSQWRKQMELCKIRHFENPKTEINILVSHYASPLNDDGTLLGYGTFPWTLDTANGGVWVNAEYAGTGNRTLTHEFGHNLGLHHTFAHFDNSVEEETCFNGDGLECYEFVHASDDYSANFVGDFAADTPTTSTNYECHDPSGGDCTGTPFGKTDYSNYMAYADDECIDHFSPNQIARAHCWLCDSPLRDMLDYGC